MDVLIIFMLLVFPVLLFVSLWAITVHNNILRMSQTVIRSWADVITYERQKIKILESLEPILTNIISHESKVYGNITSMRSSINSLNNNKLDADEIEKIEDSSQEVFKQLYAVQENYPDLKSNMLFMNQMNEIVKQNENVGAALSNFNRNSDIFNSLIVTFPNNIVNKYMTKKDLIKTFVDVDAESSFDYQPNFEKE